MYIIKFGHIHCRCCIYFVYIVYIQYSKHICALSEYICYVYMYTLDYMGVYYGYFVCFCVWKCMIANATHATLRGDFRHLHRRFSNNNVAQECAEAIACLNLESVAWLRTCKNPNEQGPPPAAFSFDACMVAKCSDTQSPICHVSGMWVSFLHNCVCVYFCQSREVGNLRRGVRCT